MTEKHFFIEDDIIARQDLEKLKKQNEKHKKDNKPSRADNRRI